MGHPRMTLAATETSGMREGRPTRFGRAARIVVLLALAWIGVTLPNGSDAHPLGGWPDAAIVDHGADAGAGVVGKNPPCGLRASSGAGHWILYSCCAAVCAGFGPSTGFTMLAALARRLETPPRGRAAAADFFLSRRFRPPIA